MTNFCASGVRLWCTAAIPFQGIKTSSVPFVSPSLKCAPWLSSSTEQWAIKRPCLHKKTFDAATIQAPTAHKNASAALSKLIAMQREDGSKGECRHTQANHECGCAPQERQSDENPAVAHQRGAHAPQFLLPADFRSLDECVILCLDHDASSSMPVLPGLRGEAGLQAGPRTSLHAAAIVAASAALLACAVFSPTGAGIHNSSEGRYTAEGKRRQVFDTTPSGATRQVQNA